ncbi:MAG: hypothetical protein ACTHW7_09055, partial [Actinomycetaceae bacterium]
TRTATRSTDYTLVREEPVNSTPPPHGPRFKVTLRFAAGKELCNQVSSFTSDSDPANVAWFSADSIQDHVVESSHWGEPIPPCGLHPHHPANFEEDGSGGITLECPYGEWSRQIT